MSSVSPAQPNNIAAIEIASATPADAKSQQPARIQAPGAAVQPEATPLINTNSPEAGQESVASDPAVQIAEHKEQAAAVRRDLEVRLPRSLSAAATPRAALPVPEQAEQIIDSHRDSETRSLNVISMCEELATLIKTDAPQSAQVVEAVLEKVDTDRRDAAAAFLIRNLGDKQLFKLASGSETSRAVFDRLTDEVIKGSRNLAEFSEVPATDARIDTIIKTRQEFMASAEFQGLGAKVQYETRTQLLRSEAKLLDIELNVFVRASMRSHAEPQSVHMIELAHDHGYRHAIHQDTYYATSLMDLVKGEIFGKLNSAAQLRVLGDLARFSETRSYTAVGPEYIPEREYLLKNIQQALIYRELSPSERRAVVNEEMLQVKNKITGHNEESINRFLRHAAMVEFPSPAENEALTQTLERVVSGEVYV